MSFLKDINLCNKCLYKRLLVLLIFSCVLLPEYLYLPWYKSDWHITLDPSWQLSLNLAWQKGLIFGKDFIFTYGPLGFLATRLELGIGKIPYILFDLFFIANALFILNFVLSTKPGIKTTILLILICLCLGNLYGSNVVFALTLMAIFWLNYGISKRKPLLLLPALIITTLLFFIKVNISFVAIFIQFIYLLYACFEDKKNRLFYITYIIISFALLWLFSYLLNVEIYGYIKGSLSIIDNYNDAMFLNIESSRIYWLITSLLLIFMMVLLLLLNDAKKILMQKSSLVLIITYSAMIYILFKQAYVRADDIHMCDFFFMYPALSGIILLFFEGKYQSYFLLAITLICGFIIVDYKGFNVEERLYRPVSYVSQILQDEEPLLSESHIEEKKLPPNIRNIIGKSSVDILPWDISLLYINDLNYNLRPVIQSYKSYNSYLMTINKNKYLGELAPEYVIFSNDAIDKRYPLFDDMYVKMVLLEHYSCIEIFRVNGKRYLLLKRFPGNKKVSIGSSQVQKFKLGEDFELAAGKDITLASFKLKYSLLGKLIRFVYSPMKADIVFTLANGDTIRYKAIPSILATRVAIDPFIMDEIDLSQLLNGRPDKVGQRVKKFRIETNYPFAFESEYEAEVSGVSLDKIQAKDLNLDPQELNKLPLANHRAIGWIDMLSIRNNTLIIDGWAYLQDSTAEKTQKFLIMQSPEVSYRVLLNYSYRHDVTIANREKNLDLDSSGFFGMINMSQLKKGKYKIAIETTRADAVSVDFWRDQQIDVK